MALTELTFVLTDLENPPNISTDTREQFNTNAQNFVIKELPELVTEITTAKTQLNAFRVEINEQVIAKFTDQQLANINTVSTNITSVNTTATNIANVNTTATNIASVNTTATNIAKVVNVSDNMTKISNLDTNMTKIANLDTNMSNIIAVNTNQNNINTVSADIIKVINVSDNIAKVSNLDTNMTKIANLDTNMSVLISLNDNIADIQNAEENANLSKQYANADEDVEVETGFYSAKHYSIKTNEMLSTKQDILISGTTIKTINGENLLGAGDIIISSQYLPTIDTLPPTSVTSNSAILWGELVSSQGFDLAHTQVRFGYKKISDTDWTYTSWVDKNTLGTFSASINSLISDTSYYFKSQTQDTTKPTLGVINASIVPFLTLSATLDTSTVINVTGSTTGNGVTALDSTSVPTLVNAIIVSNEVVASSDGASATTKEYSQEVAEPNWVELQVIAGGKPKDILISATVSTIISAVLLTAGDSLIIDDGTLTPRLISVSSASSSSIVDNTNPFLDNSLKYKFRFEDSATDLLANATTVSGSITYDSNGKFGKAGIFNGSSYISLTTAVPTKTLSFWYYGNTGTNGTALFSNGGTTGSNLASIMYWGGIGINTGNSDCFGIASSNLNANQWNHIVIYFSTVPSEIEFYVNNVKKTPTMLLGTARSSYLNMDLKYIGYGAGVYFSGKFDHIEGYNRKLTAEEILALFVQTLYIATIPTQSTAPTVTYKNDKTIQLKAGLTSGSGTFTNQTVQSMSRNGDYLQFTCQPTSGNFRYASIKTTFNNGDKFTKYQAIAKV